MDWSYNKPEIQRFIADGHTLWYYQPKDRQVTIGDFRESFESDLPVSFLMGLGKLSENFTLKESCKVERGLKLSLQPKNHEGSMQSFELLVSETRYLPLGAQVVDAGGNETKISLFNLNWDKSFEDQSFVFSIPRGVDIIDNRKKVALHPLAPLKEDDLLSAEKP